MALRAFLAEYYEGGQVYSSEIWARSWKHAQELAGARCLGEKIIGSGPILQAASCSAVLSSRAPLADKMHALCFLGLLATSSSCAEARDFFGDQGVLHQFVHYSIPIIRKEGRMTLRKILRDVEDIERRIPGYPKRFAGRQPQGVKRALRHFREQAGERL
jgi:hypothetical protein